MFATRIPHRRRGVGTHRVAIDTSDFEPPANGYLPPDDCACVWRQLDLEVASNASARLSSDASLWPSSKFVVVPESAAVAVLKPAS